MLGFFARALDKIICKISNGWTTSIWVWAAITLAIFAPITWVRTLEVFQYGNVYSIIVVYLMIIIIMTFCSLEIHENDN